MALNKSIHTLSINNAFKVSKNNLFHKACIIWVNLKLIIFEIPPFFKGGNFINNAG